MVVWHSSGRNVHAETVTERLRSELFKLGAAILSLLLAAHPERDPIVNGIIASRGFADSQAPVEHITE